jgi:hypothetical protein
VPEDCGPIAISVTYTNDDGELEGQLYKLIGELPLPGVPNGRIVLILPDSLRVRLGWRLDEAPRVAYAGPLLVFTPKMDL